jgi:MFS transporter, ACDE family, multidrug resistance protein
LFTSYFAFTGLSMLFSSVVASRIGAKRTLLAGLILIVVFSALAGMSNSVGAIVGLRAGWGLGNALFIATALSVIVGAASGGVSGAVMIYEAALGFGISLGPLLGGELGGISWRGPFFGVAVPMSIGFVAIAKFVPRTPPPPRSERVSVLEPLRALRHRATRGSGLTAVFYNFGFFTLLAYAPFPLHLQVHQLGYTFTGWGLMLALFAVFVAPRLSRRFSDVRGLAGALIGIVAVLLVMGVAHASQTALIVCVISSGAFFGITNTLMTQVVMESAPVPPPIASSAYSFVRFLGGAIAPFIAGKLGEHVSVQAPFYLGAGMTAIAVGVLWHYRASLVPVAEEAGPRIAVPDTGEDAVVPAVDHGTQVIAVGGPSAGDVCAMAVPVARARAGSGARASRSERTPRASRGRASAAEGGVPISLHAWTPTAPDNCSPANGRASKRRWALSTAMVRWRAQTAGNRETRDPRTSTRTSSTRVGARISARSWRRLSVPRRGWRRGLTGSRSRAASRSRTSGWRRCRRPSGQSRRRGATGGWEADRWSAA